MVSMEKGNVALCVGTFLDNDGTPTDPGTPLFQFRAGDGTWSAPVTPTKDSVGVYHYDLDTSLPNTGHAQEVWFARFFSPPLDQLQAAAVEQFTVTNTGQR